MNYDYEEYESLPVGASIYNYMLAGAAAGIMEHCCMYPIDSVKTRMQSLVSYKMYEGKSLYQTLNQIIQTEGWGRLTRGINIVFLGAGPAHALYFSSYEYLKKNLLHNVFQNSKNQNYHPPTIKDNGNQTDLQAIKLNLSPSPSKEIFVHGAAGICATLLHDACMNPVEVVKQRLQSYNSPYTSVINCASQVYKQEGLRAFYRSYGTQLALNLPFQITHFVTYEYCRRKFFEYRQKRQTNQNTNSTKKYPNERIFYDSSHSDYYDPVAHMISGALAGGLAAAITNPLDVCKTLLNTQEFVITDPILTQQQQQQQHSRSEVVSNDKSTKAIDPKATKCDANTTKPVGSIHNNNSIKKSLAYRPNVNHHLNVSTNLRSRFTRLNKPCITVLSTLSSSATPYTQLSEGSSINNPDTFKPLSKVSYRDYCTIKSSNNHPHPHPSSQQRIAINGLFQAARTIYSVRGLSGFSQGLQARCVYQMPATAFSWSVYEFFKYCLSK